MPTPHKKPLPKTDCENNKDEPGVDVDDALIEEPKDDAFKKNGDKEPSRQR